MNVQDSGFLATLLAGLHGAVLARLIAGFIVTMRYGEAFRLVLQVYRAEGLMISAISGFYLVIRINENRWKLD